jgi:DHA2 family metal-tetracycline-proton antiporter-like MFS transporter
MSESQVVAKDTRKPGEASVDSYTGNAKHALIPLLVIFILGTLCLQAFNLVFQQIGDSLGASQQASLITAIPGIVLGIVCFVYGSLTDFISLKKMVLVGLIVLLASSICGYLFNGNILLVIVFRALQTAGAQVAGSVYLVIAAKYLKSSEKVVYFGIFTAGYQLSTAIGVLAGGFLSSINWAYLFLIPVLSIFVVPFLFRNLPSGTVKGSRIDVLGFGIFGLAIAALTLFFSNINWVYLAASAVLFIVFAVYISKARHPFISVAFFRNTRWLKGITLILVFYAINYCFTPLFNGIGKLYGLSSASVSLYLVWAFIVATIVATSSGMIVRAIGRQAAIITAAILMVVGLLTTAICVNQHMALLAITACIYYAGMGLLYSPVVDTVLGTLDSSETGRGIGMNDLAMNVTASIGIAIFGSLMGTGFLSSGSIGGQSGAAANYANLLLIFAGIVLVGLVVYLVFRRSLNRSSEEGAA